LFPPRIWARTIIPLDFNIKVDLTNNPSESWNRQLNGHIKDSMQIKEFIQLLQKLEKEQRTKILNQIQNTNLEKENEQLIEERV